MSPIGKYFPGQAVALMSPCRITLLLSMPYRARKTVTSRRDGGHLRRCRRPLFEIADQCDSDSALVVFVFAGVSAWQLLPPAKRRFDLAVPHAVPISDDEVVPDAHPGVSVAVRAFEMGRVDTLHTSVR